MDKHWTHFCTMSIVHFMAFPKAISGEGPIAESVARIAEDPFFGAVEITWIKDPKERAAAKPGPGLTIPDTGLSLEEVEKNLIVQALEKAGQNKTQAAKLLGITYDSLRYQAKKFGLE